MNITCGYCEGPLPEGQKAGVCEECYDLIVEEMQRESLIEEKEANL